jgi:DNA-binding SARP family transcriptional activator
MLARPNKLPKESRPPVRVYALGRFAIEANGVRVDLGPKSQRRTLDLLKVLISFGGESATTEQISDALWPDSDGDAAYDALRTTASRLRKLIGRRAIRCKSGRWALDPGGCWVDALVFPTLVEGCKRELTTGAALAHERLDQTLALYGGPFLPGESGPPSVISARRKLRTHFQRGMIAFGEALENAGRLDEVLDRYQRAIQADPAAEELAARFMQRCLSAAKADLGLSMYRDCVDALSAEGHAEPSSTVRNAYQALLSFVHREQQTPSNSPGAPAHVPTALALTDLSIAVLPFVDRSPLGGQQRIADAVRDTLLSLLSALPQLTVITNFNSDADWGRSESNGLLLRRPAVRYLLQGAITVSEQRLRATVSFTDARNGQHQWSEVEDYPLQDVIQSQDQIAIRAATNLAQRLIFGEGTKILLNRNVNSWKAAALAVVYYDRQHRRDVLRARTLLARLIENDREAPEAAAMLAGMKVFQYWKRWGANPAMSLHAGERSLREFRERYRREGYGLGALAWACALRGDFREAFHHGRDAEETRPGGYMSHALFGVAYAYGGQYGAALEKFNDTFRARPKPPHWAYKDRAVAQFCLGRYDEAAAGLATALVDEYPLHKDSDLYNARMIYVAGLAAAGQQEQARHEAQTVLKEHPAVSAGCWRRSHFQPFIDQGPAERIERLLIAAGLPA